MTSERTKLLAPLLASFSLMIISLDPAQADLLDDTKQWQQEREQKRERQLEQRRQALRKRYDAPAYKPRQERRSAPARRRPAAPSYRSSSASDWNEVASYLGRQPSITRLIKSGRINAVKGFRQAYLSDLDANTDTVFYPFSGPDFVYPDLFFPNATTLILGGLEPVGDIDRFAAQSKEWFLNHLRPSLHTTVADLYNFSFHVTTDMQKDIGNVLNDNNETNRTGVVPYLLMYMGIAGHTVTDVTKVGLTAEGKLTGNRSETFNRELTGVAISYRDRGARKKLYYFGLNIHNNNRSAIAALTGFAASFNRFTTYLKAASNLMHDRGFDKIRNFIIDRSGYILQTESGILYRHIMAGGNWHTRLFGDYTGSYLGGFDSGLSNAYARARANGSVFPLTIPYSYNHRDPIRRGAKRKKGLQLYMRRAGKGRGTRGMRKGGRAAKEYGTTGKNLSEYQDTPADSRRL